MLVAMDTTRHAALRRLVPISRRTSGGAVPHGRSGDGFHRRLANGLPQTGCDLELFQALRAIEEVLLESLPFRATEGVAHVTVNQTVPLYFRMLHGSHP